MFRFDAPDSEVLPCILLGEVIAVERFGSPVQVVILTYASGRRVHVTASSDDLMFGEDGLTLQ